VPEFSNSNFAPSIDAGRSRYSTFVNGSIPPSSRAGHGMPCPYCEDRTFAVEVRMSQVRYKRKSPGARAPGLFDF
jgi:hypothetical protein